jgi:hypothetical protein
VCPRKTPRAGPRLRGLDTQWREGLPPPNVGLLCSHTVCPIPFWLPRRIELYGQLSIFSREMEESFLQFWIIGAGGMCFVADRIAQVFSRFFGVSRHDALP